MSSTPTSSTPTRSMARLGRRALVLGTAAVAGLAGAWGAALVASPAASAATGSGSATGSSQTTGHFAHFPPPCSLTETLTYRASGTASYTATMGGRTATYSGPVQLTLAKTSAPGYGGPFGTHGYSPTCDNPAGTPFDVTATTTGSTGSASVSCTYTGTLSRINPTLGNGTDTATAILTGTCTVSQGGVVVSGSPTSEVRTISYVLDSCTGGPAPNFACRETTTFTATSSAGPLSVITTSLPRAGLLGSYSATVAATGGTPPYTFSLAPGSSLPIGLSLASDGVISGTPALPGSTGFTVVVTDSSGASATQALTIAVGGCNRTVSGAHPGTLVLGPGVTCISGARVSGSLLVPVGAAVVTGSQVDGSVVSTGARSVSLCSSRVGGAVLVRRTTGLVLAGDAGDDGSPGCGANHVAGSTVLSDNAGGVEVGGNTIGGALVVTGTTGNSSDRQGAAAEIEGNALGGSLVCTANSPAPVDDQQANAIGGSSAGQCPGLGGAPGRPPSS